MSEEREFVVSLASEDANLEYFIKFEDKNSKYIYCYIASIEETATFVQIYKKEVKSVNLYKASLTILFKSGIQVNSNIIGFFREGFPISFDLDYEDVHRNLLGSAMKLKISIQEIEIDENTYEKELKNEIKYTQAAYTTQQKIRNDFDMHFKNFLLHIKNLNPELVPENPMIFQYFEHHRQNFLDIDVSDFDLVIKNIQKDDTILKCKDLSTGRVSEIKNFMEFIKDGADDLYEAKDPTTGLNCLGPISLHRIKYWLPGSHFYIRVKNGCRLLLAQEKETYKIDYQAVKNPNMNEYLALTPYKTGPIVMDKGVDVFIHIDVSKASDLYILQNTTPHIYYKGEEKNSTKIPNNTEHIYDARQIQIDESKSIVIAYSDKFLK